MGCCNDADTAAQFPKATELQLVTVDLAATAGGDWANLAAGVARQETGVGMLLLRAGSNPGARLELAVNGQSISKTLQPGQRLRGAFNGFTVKRAVGCARVGRAFLVIFTKPEADLSEPAVMDAVGPIDLLGVTDPSTGEPVTYVNVAEDTDPAGAAPTGSFDISGWSLLRVLIDGNTAGGNFTTSDLVPWNDPGYAGNWHEQGIDRISIPDSDTSGQRFRSFTLPVAGRGLMYLVPRNLQAAARTGLNLIVQGLR